MSYKAFILLPETYNGSMNEVVDLIKKGFEADSRKVNIYQIEDKIEVFIENWKYLIFFRSDASVLVESKELAEKFARNFIEKSEIENCSKRFEIICDEDLEMDFFNDYLTILQELKSIPNAKVWEQARQEFI